MSDLPVLRVRRLGMADVSLARRLFAMMAAVFDEPSEPLSDVHLDTLLRRPDFWALAALMDDVVVGGVTAHALPMTTAERSTLFLYDIAVRADHQRRGIGRALVAALRTEAAAAGIGDLFVVADDEDVHALDFYRALGGMPSSVTMFSWERA